MSVIFSTIVSDWLYSQLFVLKLIRSATDKKSRPKSGSITMDGLCRLAKVYIALTFLACAAALWIAAPQWNAGSATRFLCYFAVALLASNLKVSVPGITGTISVNFIFVLIGVMDLSLIQVLLVTYAGTAGQFIFRAKTRKPLRLAFNLASATISSICCFEVYHSVLLKSIDDSIPLLLFASSATLFAVNTSSVAGIIALSEGKPFWTVWYDGFFWTSSHHLVGAGVATVFHFQSKYLGWESVVLTVPVVYLVYRSYSLHLTRLDSARKHAAELGDLHWRAIEALALAIDAKDETTHSHLLRVKVYATEIAKELKLGESEMQAVQAAALLHDIGKLAVPEYIISKPGKLTQEEFEKMKVHPVVGAEILERVRFPYPVVPIVRAHHEKWNGQGYPAGLCGEEIPVGARILAAVDCLDALASDRQYRRALPLDEAMAIVVSEAGSSFDPRIVEILKRRYVELERMATSLQSAEEPKLSKNVRVHRGGGPASGYAEVSSCVASPVKGRRINGLLDCEDLKRAVPYDVAVVFAKGGDTLLPVWMSGPAAHLLGNESVQFGEGVTGWVADSRKPIVNGNPAVESGYTRVCGLLSALSLPLERDGDLIGVLTLYSKQVNAFTNQHLRSLLAFDPEAILALGNTRDQGTQTRNASLNALGTPRIQMASFSVPSARRAAVYPVP